MRQTQPLQCPHILQPGKNAPCPLQTFSAFAQGKWEIPGLKINGWESLPQDDGMMSMLQSRGARDIRVFRK